MFYSRSFLVLLMSAVVLTAGCRDDKQSASSANVLSANQQQSVPPVSNVVSKKVSEYFTWKVCSDSDAQEVSLGWGVLRNLISEEVFFKSIFEIAGFSIEKYVKFIELQGERIAVFLDNSTESHEKFAVESSAEAPESGSKDESGGESGGELLLNKTEKSPPVSVGEPTAVFPSPAEDSEAPRKNESIIDFNHEKKVFFVRSLLVFMNNEDEGYCYSYHEDENTPDVFYIVRLKPANEVQRGEGKGEENILNEKTEDLYS